MANLRDSLLPAVDSIRGFEAVFGTRRFAVTIRRRVWSGQTPGEGTATDYNFVLTPKPRVRDITDRQLTATEAELRSANNMIFVGNMYKISQITPRYTPASSGQVNGATGGYLAEQLRMWPNADTGAIQNLVVLVGDDGYLRECEQVTFAQDRMLSYSMIVKETDRPRTPLVSIAVSPATASLLAASSQQQQLTVTGTFVGGSASVLTVLSNWTSSNPAVATVDVYGNVTAVSAGSTTITALCLQQTSTAVITVS